MVLENILFYLPLTVAILVLIGSFLIKWFFRRNQSLTLTRFDGKRYPFMNGNSNRVISRDGKKRAVFMNGMPFLLLAILMATVWVSWQTWSTAFGNYIIFKPYYIVSGFIVIFQVIVSSTAKPFVCKPSDVENLDISVIVPIYNEDKNSLRECLKSMFYQSRKPKEISIVDDGSSVDYGDIEKWFLERAKELGIIAHWQKQKNSGKRSAHVKAMEPLTTPKDNLIIVTVDSDGILDPNAFEEGLKPFANGEIQSVAGTMVSNNAKKNVLSRITDVIFTSQQLIDRMFMSQFKTVLVNSGALAFYRAEVIYTAIRNGYDNEYFFGVKVNFSDDSYLTLIAMLMGSAVQQASSVVFADMPVTFKHHLNQQFRWNRGSFIRSWWRLRYLPVNSFGWWRQAIGHCIFLSTALMLLEIVVAMPIINQEIPPVEILIIPFIFGVLQYSRYFIIKRSDMGFFSRCLSAIILSPMAVIWSMTFLRFVRIYSFITCKNTGWLTRAKVEKV